MKKLTERQWGDVASRLTNRPCSVCGEYCICHEPRYAEVGGIEMLITTCAYCGHVELFDVAELTIIADRINEDFIKKGQRKG